MAKISFVGIRMVEFQLFEVVAGLLRGGRHQSYFGETIKYQVPTYKYITKAMIVMCKVLQDFGLDPIIFTAVILLSMLYNQMNTIRAHLRQTLMLTSSCVCPIHYCTMPKSLG